MSSPNTRRAWHDVRTPRDAPSPGARSAASVARIDTGRPFYPHGGSQPAAATSAGSSGLNLTQGGAANESNNYGYDGGFGLVAKPANDDAAYGRGGRVSDLHQQLLHVERQLTEMREQSAAHAAQAEMLAGSLQQEHEASLRLQHKHNQEVDHIRSEYERQNAHLIEQLTVVKGESEASLLDRKRVTDDATLRKQQLMQLLEREREEKAHIMNDYRLQTEALISEQGREITGLRALLDQAREEEEKLGAALKRGEDRRNEAEDQLMRAEAVLSEERIAAQRNLREADQRHQAQLDALRHAHESHDAEQRAAHLKLQTLKERLEDELRSATERAKVLEQSTEHERGRIRAAYDADVEALQEDLRTAKTQRETVERTLRAEVDRLAKGDEELVASLRRAADTARLEKQAAFEDNRQQKESLVAEAAARNAQQQSTIDALRSELADERAARKDAETARQSLAIRAESQQHAIARLTADMESAQVDARTRERTMEADLHAVANELRSVARAAEAQSASLAQQVKRLDLDNTRLADELASRQAQHDAAATDSRRHIDSLRLSLEGAAQQHEQAKTHYTRTIDTLQAQKVQLEADGGRLGRQVAELDARTHALAKQLADERRALEQATAECQSLRASLGDFKQAVDTERQKAAATAQALAEREGELRHLRDAHDEATANVREARRQADRTRDELAEAARVHEAQLVDVRNAARLQAAALEEQLAAHKEAVRTAKDTVAAAEEAAKALREEVTRLQREGISRDESHSDAIRALRRDADDELGRLDGIIAALRDDVARAQSARAAAQREVADATRDGERRVAIVQEAIETERHAKQRLHEELRAKEQLVAEMHGTTRLFASRLQSKEDDAKRLDAELEDTITKLHDAHSALGRKDATIGQLMAKLRVYESRGTL